MRRSGRTKRVELARPEIVRFFTTSRKRVYTRSELASAFSQNKATWQLPDRMSVEEFLEYLVKRTDMRKLQLEGEAPHRDLYGWQDPSQYGVALALRPGSYLSHGTAVFLHGLTDQVPATIYANKEQRPKNQPQRDLTQEAIDKALSRPQRQSKNILRYNKWRIVLLNGKFTDRLEVAQLGGLSEESLEVTKVERTLIDIAVRPAYAGGVQQILEAYRRAKEKMSTNVLMATLRKLEYSYPYHQAIGFYMERAGYEPQRYERLTSFGIYYDFYLVHGMRETDYSSKWRLYFPKGF